MNYIHRDIKPDNILIDKTGHIKLADFGSCLKLDEFGKAHCKVAVGTPDYICPEILRAMEDGKGTYGKECDWWSFGICIYEMLFGEVPFYAESLVDTYSKIVEQKFTFPTEIQEAEVSFVARDLIKKLICPAEVRIGNGECSEIFQHSFFKGIDWKNLHSIEPPYVPEFCDDSDTSNFEEFSDTGKSNSFIPPSILKNITGQLPFIGFTYLKMNNLFDNSSVEDPYSISILEKFFFQNCLKDSPLKSVEDCTNGVLDREESQDIEFPENNELLSALNQSQNGSILNVHLKQSVKTINTLNTKQSGVLKINEHMSKELDQAQRICTDLLQKIRSEKALEQNILSSDDDLGDLLVQLRKEFESLESERNDLKDYISEHLIGTSSNISSDKDPLVQQHFTTNMVKSEENLGESFNPVRDMSATEGVTEFEKIGENVQPFSDIISNLLNTVDIEKRARLSLETIATDLMSELDQIKRSGINFGVKNESWVERRSLKNESQKLHELQLAFDSELNTKIQISEELAKSKEQQALCETQIHSLTKQNNELYSVIQSNQEEIVRKEVIISELKCQLDYKKLHGTGVSGTTSFVANVTSIEVTDGINPNEMQKNVSYNSVIGNIASLSSNSTISETPPSSPFRFFKDDKISYSPTKSHHFLISTFLEPSICDFCSSFMLGLIRQGVRCGNCNYQCHMLCADFKDIGTCPAPLKERKLTFNAATGIGTVYQGLVRVPKPAGVKKGWIKQLMIICDYKIFFYEAIIDKLQNLKINQIIDIRDEDFFVGKVIDSEVIHAHPKLVPQIFKISSCLRGCKELNPSILVLMLSEEIRDTVLTILSELKTFVKKNKISKIPVYRPIELYDSSQLDLLRYINASCTIDQERILLGCDDGLFVLDVPNNLTTRLCDKRIFQLDYIVSEEIFLYLGGRQRKLRMVPKTFHEIDLESVKISDTKGAQFFVSGIVHHSNCIAVAIRKRIVLFEITKSSNCKYSKIKEIYIDNCIQSINILNSQLCVGYTSGFLLYAIQGDFAPQLLINVEDQSLNFISDNSFDSLGAFELDHGNEFLICFELLALYVDSNGNRSRQEEIKWLSPPNSIIFQSPFLIAFCDSSVDIYDPNTGNWVQTIPLRRSQVLSKDGTIILSYQCDPPRLIYLKNVSVISKDAIQLKLSESFTFLRKNQSPRQKVSKAMLDVWRNKSEKRPLEISPPTDFSHIQHVGSKDFFVLSPVPADADDPHYYNESISQKSYHFNYSNDTSIQRFSEFNDNVMELSPQRNSFENISVNNRCGKSADRLNLEDLLTSKNSMQKMTKQIENDAHKENLNEHFI